MRWLLLLIAALAFGCDDPEVASRAASILEHGAVSARIECSGTAVYDGVLGTATVTYRAHRLVDGSVIAKLGVPVNNTDATSFWERNEDGAALNRVETTVNGPMTVDFFDGEFASNHFDNFDMDCTGFNLAAFGVEP